VAQSQRTIDCQAEAAVLDCQVLHACTDLAVTVDTVPIAAAPWTDGTRSKEHHYEVEKSIYTQTIKIVICGVSGIYL
jgi:hypothetical protein